MHASTRDPSEVLACLGLHRLAERLYPGCTGYWASGRFFLGAPADEVVGALRAAEIITRPSVRGKKGSLQLGPPLGLWLNWWRRRKGLRTWSGQQAVRETLPLLLGAMPAYSDDLLRHQTLLPGGKSSLAWDCWRTLDARDIGFAPDAVGMAVACRPAVELLAIIGLQSCWPHDMREPDADGESAGQQCWRYVTWDEPRTFAAARASYRAPQPGDRLHYFGWSCRGGRYWGPTLEQTRETTHA